MGSAIIAQLNGSSALLRSYWALCSYTSTYCQRGAACWVQGSSCNLTLLQMLLCACIRVLFLFFFITFLQSAANCWALSHNSFSHTQTGNDRNATVAARSATPPNTCLPALCQRHGAWWETGLTSEANQWIGGIKQKFLCPCCRFDLCQSRWGSSWWSAMSKICLIGLN